MERPKNVEFKAYVVCVGVCHHVIEKRSILIRLEFITMVVITKRKAMLFFQYLSRCVKIRNSFLGRLNCKRSIVRNPCDANVGCAKRFCILRYLTCFVDEIRIANSERGASHTPFVEHLSQFSGRLSKKIGEFDVSNAQLLDGI